MEVNKQKYNRYKGEPKWMDEVLSKYGIHQIDDGGINNWRHTNGVETCAFSGEINGYWAISVYINTDKNNKIKEFGLEKRVETFYCAEKLDEYMKEIEIEKKISKQK